MNITYGSKIDLAYIVGSEEVTIESERISFIILDYQYDKAHMPMIYVSLNLNISLYDDIINNIGKGLFRFTLYRYNTSSRTALKTKSISQLFTYLIPTNVEYNKELTDSHSFKSGVLALVSLDNINNNKRIFNDIIKNSNMISIIHKYTSHIPMIIEPLRYNNPIDYLIIPPTSTLTNLIKFLNSQQQFYKTPYRFFRDFDKSYLLGSSGNAVVDGSSKYDTCIIHINDLTKESTNTGMEIDDSKRLITLYINAQDTSMDINIDDDLHFNNIIGYDIYGNTYRKEIEGKHDTNNDRTILKYFSTGTLEDNMDSLVHDINSTSIILNIIKSEIDPTQLTPNKEYLVYNYPAYRQYDGRYILSYKKEMMVQQDGEFISSTVFGLRKVLD